MVDALQDILPPETYARLTDIRHGTPEWHTERAKNLTGTDIAAILGNSKWKTPLRVWSRLVMEQGGDSAKETAFMRWGNLLEGQACAEFESITGLTVLRCDRLARHARLPFLIGSPDGFAFDPFIGSVGCVEVKAPSAFTRDEWGEDQAPAYYVNQLETYLCILGLTWGVIVAILPPMGADDELIVTTTIHLTPERKAEIESTLEAWWFKHVVGEEQPDAIFRDEKFLKSLHPNDEPRTVLLEGDVLERAETFERLKDEAKAAKEAADTAKAQLIQRMGKAAWAATEDGSMAVSFRTNKREVRSLKLIPRLPNAAPLPSPTQDGDEAVAS